MLQTSHSNTALYGHALWDFLGGGDFVFRLWIEDGCCFDAGIIVNFPMPVLVKVQMPVLF